MWKEGKGSAHTGCPSGPWQAGLSGCRPIPGRVGNTKPTPTQEKCCRDQPQPGCKPLLAAAIKIVPMRASLPQQQEAVGQLPDVKVSKRATNQQLMPVRAGVVVVRSRPALETRIRTGGEQQ